MSADTWMIFIGGPKHGKTLRTWGLSCVVVPLLPLPRGRYFYLGEENFPDPDFIMTGRYHERIFGLKGTRRRISYMVLEGLSNEETWRLIQEYESSPDAITTQHGRGRR